MLQNNVTGTTMAETERTPDDPEPFRPRRVAHRAAQPPHPGHRPGRPARRPAAAQRRGRPRPRSRGRGAAPASRPWWRPRPNGCAAAAGCTTSARAPPDAPPWSTRRSSAHLLAALRHRRRPPRGRPGRAGHRRRGQRGQRGARACDAAEVGPGDVAVGVAASGRTPYVAGALATARAAGAFTVLVSANPGAPLAHLADVHVAVDTGPEAIAGSTRLKAASAHKLVLNGLSTAVMVALGRTYSNLMVDVSASNAKLRGRLVTIPDGGHRTRRGALRARPRRGGRRTEDRPWSACWPTARPTRGAAAWPPPAGGWPTPWRRSRSDACRARPRRAGPRPAAGARPTGGGCAPLRRCAPGPSACGPVALGHPDEEAVHDRERGDPAGHRTGAEGGLAHRRGQHVVGVLGDLRAREVW
ncbi:SIS domain-containing protein [Streptomyces sp. TLI_171]|nr:SIS domain-containing protein [Streptomyces sp. TLI_171]